MAGPLAVAGDGQPPPPPLLAAVPTPGGCTRLGFAWALGPRLLLTPLGGSEEVAASVVQWCADALVGLSGG